LYYALPYDLYEALQSLSRQEKATLYMTLLAAFQTLLYRYTGQEDVAVGTAIAGRTRAEVEYLIGIFINMLVMRADLSGNPSFRELLNRVREMALGAYAHQDIPFEKLVEELQPQRVLSQTPFFQVAFGLQNAPLQSLQLPTLKMNPLTFKTDIARYDLTLWMLEEKDRLTASWTYRTDLFEPATIARMHGHFETLLRSIVENPEARVSALEMLTLLEKEEKHLQEKQSEEAKIKKLLSVKRRAISRVSDRTA
jgi:non-ribosomal peptide synthetase component F